MRYPAYLETRASGQTRGYIFRLPGLFLDAASAEETMGGLAERVRAEHEWLAGHGLHLPHVGESVEIEEIERIALDTDIARGVWRGLFRYELRPTTTDDVATCLERTGFARRELMARLEGLDLEAPGLLGERILTHCDEEWKLLSRLGTRLDAVLPGEPLARLIEIRKHARDRLEKLLPGDIERLAVFDGEKWTTRKVLRRLAVGERILLRDFENLPAGGKSAAASSGRIADQSPR